MATVIDSLVVTLGLDPSKFTQGQREALEALRATIDQAEAGGKRIEAQGAKVAEYFNGVKRQALGLAGVLLGATGAKALVEKFTTANAEISHMSKILNISAHELSAWQGVARMTGGSAGTITSSFLGLSQAIETFKLTGQGSFLPVMQSMGLSLKDDQGNAKTMTQIYLDMAAAMEKMNPENRARSSAYLSMIPGMNLETIGMLIKGGEAVTKLLEENRKLSTVTKESAENAEKLATGWARLTIVAENLAKPLLDGISPALQAILGFSTYLGTKLFGGELLKEDPAAKAKRLQKEEDDKKANPQAYPRRGVGELYGAAKGNLGGLAEKYLGGGTGLFPTAGVEEQEAYIRQQAILRGINPDVAVKVARSEGLGGAYQSQVRRKDGSREESYGPFQLFMGGGLGNKALAQGIDPRDPSTWRDQVKFSLDEAKKSGWGAWHGWRGLPFEGIAAGSAGGGGPRAMMRDGDSTRTTTITTNIAKIEVVGIKDAEGFARDVTAQLDRANKAASANYALTG